MVLVVLFPLPDEKNVDVNQLFSGHVCLLENMKPRVLIMWDFHALARASATKPARGLPALIITKRELLSARQ